MSGLSDVFASVDAGEGLPHPVLAEKVVAHLDETDPGRLHDWLRSRAVSLIALEVRFWRHATRRTTRSGKVGRFADEAERYAETGDPAPIRNLFAAQYRVNDDGDHKTLGEMTAADHRFVADRYAATSERAALLASFHRTLAKKCGRRTTAEVLSEETFLELQTSILGRAA